MTAPTLTDEQRADWNRDGFLLVPGFAETEVLTALTAAVVDMARRHDRGESIGDAYVVAEEALVAEGVAPEERLSKIFRVHRQIDTFHDLAVDDRLLDLIEALLGTADLDCFLSQFIFKNPCAWGQPWHQDSFYFPFDRSPQVGIWLAVTRANRENGCLFVLPGSHKEPVHAHVPDRRPNANVGYVEIIDHDMSGEIPVLMDPGDLLVFHSHLMHRSKDNESDDIRAAMVFHYASAGTRDLSGRDNVVNDWKPVRRVG